MILKKRAFAQDQYSGRVIRSILCLEGNYCIYFRLQMDLFFFTGREIA
jgi:hypothetical protein